jgi:hypothetical protein
VLVSGRIVFRAVFFAGLLVAFYGYVFDGKFAPHLTAFIALMAAFVAYLSLQQTRELARKKATIDLIETSESKDYYQERYASYRAYRRATSEERVRVAYASDKDKRRSALRQKCWDFLNHYELVAIAGKQKLIDLDFYGDWMKPNLVRDWNEAEFLVNSARGEDRPGDEVNKVAFENFEGLAVSWGGKPLRRK